MSPLFGLRRRPDPLGDGAWRRAHDRFLRAVDRVHQVLDGVPAGPVHDGVAAVAADLAGLTGDVRDLCVRLQATAPGTGSQVPGGSGGRYLDAHRALSRAATLAAQAAEAAVMAKVALPDPVALDRVAAAARAAQAARALVDEAVRVAQPPS